MLTASSTRDLVRFRRLNTPLLELAQAFLSVLSAESQQGSTLRLAFFPALLGTDLRPKDPLAMETTDERLRGLFEQGPAAIIVPQGNITPQQVASALSEGKGPVYDSLFIGWTLHQQLLDAKGSGERVEEANLGIMVVATLAHELAQWIFLQTHGHRDAFSPLDDGGSIHTTDTRGSVSSFGSSAQVRPKNRLDVGDRAVISLFGCDYELLSYTIGEHELVKRRFPSRRSPTMTPPIVYSIIKDTPAILDATSQGLTVTRKVPTWRDPADSMYSVVSVLTPAGTTSFHGDCTLPEPNGREYAVSLTSTVSLDKM